MLFSIIGFAQIPTSGLVAHYPFNGNANDESTNSNDGTVNGATLTDDRFGNVNSAYSFDGVNDTITLNLQQSNITAYSISAWFKTSNGGAILAGQGTNGETGITLHAHNAATGGAHSGKLLYVADGAAVSVGKLTDSTFSDDKWHHVVGVFNGAAGSVSSTMFSIYVDNNLVSQSTSLTGSASAPINNLTNVLLGAHHIWPNGGLFDGLLDDIRIYDTVLDSSDVSALFNEHVCYKTITVQDTLNIYLSNIITTVYEPADAVTTVKVYPNPSANNITVEIDNYANLSGVTLKVINSQSAEVHNEAVTGATQSIDISTWSAGIYFLQVLNGSDIVDIRKIVVNN
jgi:hypothetical protein